MSLNVWRNFHCIKNFNLAAELGLNISRSTLSRALKQQGIYARVAARKLFINPRQAEQRFQFSAEYGDKDKDWWSNVIFFDEKTFR